MAKEKNKLTRVLSIDGGGIRGIIPGQILVNFEDRLKARTGNSDARISDYFDLIAGTSTGGILTCAYLSPDQKKKTRPRFTAREVVDLYLERGDEIFNIPFKHKLRSLGGVKDEKYPAAEFEEALNDYFGEMKLSELLKPCLITAYDIKRRKGHFFTQHDAVSNPAHDFLLREVARATSAAPTYFECSKVKSLTNIPYPLIDGGVFVNNPALCAYAEVHKKFNITAKGMVILSLGTGFSRKEYDYNTAKDWGLAGWVQPLIDIMMSGVADVVDYQLQQIYHAVGAPSQYLRINAALPGDVNSDMDDASQQNLLALKQFGTEIAQNHAAQLDAFIDLLIN